MSDFPPCDPEIFKKGEGICIFHAAAKIVEPWVKKVAAESGQRVDWHYSGGMVNMLFIGDYLKVREAIVRLQPELDATCYAHDGHGAVQFRILPPGSHGLYRRGDELPDDVRAIDTTGSS